MSETLPATTFERVYTLVSAEIFEGQFRPGDRISVKELALKLRVSTTPLREVLSRLVGRGIVQERRAEGYYLARMDAQDLSDLYELHSVCMVYACSKLRSVPPGIGIPIDAWVLFDMVAKHSGDDVLMQTRAQLDDRLRAVRSLERELISEHRCEIDSIRAAIACSDKVQTDRLIIEFPNRRRASAANLALRLGRAPKHF